MNVAVNNILPQSNLQSLDLKKCNSRKLSQLLKQVNSVIVLKKTDVDVKDLLERSLEKIKKIVKIDEKQLVLKILYSTSEFNKDFTIGIFKKILSKHLDIPIESWIENEAKEHIKELCVKIIEGNLEEAKCFYETINSFIGHSIWKDITSDRGFQKFVFSLCRNDVTIKDKIVALSKICNDTTVKLLKKCESNTGILRIIKNAIIENTDCLEWLNNFLDVYQNKPETVILGELSEKYPFHLKTLCKLFLKERSAEWAAYINQRGINSGAFLDVAEKLYEIDSVTIIIFSSFVKYDKLMMIAPFLVNLPKTALPQVIRNLFRIYHFEQKSLDKMIEKISSEPKTFLLFIVIGGLSAKTQYVPRMELVYLLTNKNIVKSEILYDFLNQFQNYLIFTNTIIQDAIVYLISKNEEALFEAIKNNFRVTALKKMIYLLYQYNEIVLADQLKRLISCRWGVYKGDAIEALYQVKQIPPKMAYHIDALIDRNQENLALVLLEMQKTSSKYARMSLEIAERAESNTSASLLYQALKGYNFKFEYPDFAMICNICLNYSDEVIGKFITIKNNSSTKKYAKEFYDFCVAYYDKHKEISPDLVCLIRIFNEKPLAANHLLAYLKDNHADLPNSEKIRICLHKGDDDTALSCSRNSAKFQKLMMHKPIYTSIRVFARSLQIKESINTRALSESFQKKITSYLNTVSGMDNESRYEAVSIEAYRLLVETCTFEYNIFNISLAVSLVKTDIFKKNLSQYIVNDTIQQLYILNSNKDLRNRIEKLFYEGNQNTNFAVILRSIFKLKRYEKITSRHLALFAYMALLKNSRQALAISSCVGVSALNNFRKNKPEFIVDLVQMLAKYDGVYIGKDRYFIPCYFLFDNRDLETINVESSEQIQKLPGFKQICLFAELTEHQQLLLAKTIYDDIAETGKISHIDLLNKFLAHVNLQNEDKFQYYQIYFGTFIPLCQRLFENIFASCDQGRFNIARKELLRLFEENINNSPLKGSRVLEAFNREFYKKVHTIFDQSSGKLQIYAANSVPSRYVTLIKDSAGLHKIYVSCAARSVESMNIKNKTIELINYPPEIIDRRVKSKFEKKYDVNVRTGDYWEYLEGVNPRRMWKKLTGKDEYYSRPIACRNSDALFKWLLQRLTLQGGYRANSYLYADTFFHSINIDWSHSSLEPFRRAANINDYIKTNVCDYARKVSQTKTINRCDIELWITKIKEELPLELQDKWVKRTEACINKDDEYLLVAFRNIIFDGLVEICGSREVVKIKYEGVLDNYGYTKLDNEYIKRASLVFIDSNWIDFSTGSCNFFKFFFSPFTEKWEFWKCDENGTAFKADYAELCGDDNVFTYFIQ